MGVAFSFLEWVWGSGPRPAGLYGEFRGLREGEPARQQFIALPTSEQVVQDVIDYCSFPNRDVFFGVIPRTRPGGTAADVWHETDVLWADVDAKMHNHSKQEALAALMTMSPAPQVVVDSGGGYHAYWKLSETIALPSATAVMKGIAKVVGGDHTYDAPRILRVPGTANHKYSGYPLARILAFNRTRLYRPADFEDLIEREVPRSPRHLEPGEEWRARRNVLPSWLDELINTSAPKGTRSEAGFKAALWLWRYGYTAEEIEQVFATAPVGEKYREEGNGHRWLSRMLTKFD